MFDSHHEARTIQQNPHATPLEFKDIQEPHVL